MAGPLDWMATVPPQGSGTAPLIGVGAIAAVPAGSTNGTPLGTRPAGAVGARFYLGSSDSVTYTVAAAQPGSAPPAYVAAGPGIVDEPLAAGMQVYVTAQSGTPLFRWV